MWGGIPQAPDFIVVGGRYGYGNRVMLLASKELSYVELREKMEPLNQIYRDPHWAPKIEIYLTAEMRSYITVHANSYPEAWQTLFDRWTPESDQQELPAVRELTE